MNENIFVSDFKNSETIEIIYENSGGEIRIISNRPSSITKSFAVIAKPEIEIRAKLEVRNGKEKTTLREYSIPLSQVLYISFSINGKIKTHYIRLRNGQLYRINL